MACLISLLFAVVMDAYWSLNNPNEPNSHRELIKVLLESGVNPNEVALTQENLMYDNRGKGAIYYTLSYNETLLPLLQQYGATDEDIFLAVMSCSPKKQEKYLESYMNKVDINYISYDSALHRVKNLALAQRLIDKGTNVNAQNINGQTPLMTHHRDVDMQKFLLDNGADMHIKDNVGDTLAFYTLKAVRSNDWDFSETLQLLIANGLDVNECDKDGHSLLYLAEERIFEESSEFLRENGAKMTQIDEQLQREKNLNKELVEVLESCIAAPKEELESLKAKVLTLIEKGAVIDEEKIAELETYISDLEQEYWDDRAVYAGRSVKDSEEYRLLQVLKKFHKAKDKAKAFDSLFTPKTSQSKGVTYQPKTKAALKKLIKDESIYLGDIDVSGVSDFTNLFDKSKRKDFSGIEKWNVSHIKDMSFCFVEARHFNHDISSWDVSNVEYAADMFLNAKKFNQNLDSWGDKLPEGCRIGYWSRFVACSPIDGKDKKPKWFVTTEDGLLKKNSGTHQPR